MSGVFFNDCKLTELPFFQNAILLNNAHWHFAE